MRYSFHGKKRFGGQAVDGFIEAQNSSEAIDNLAEEGIIGVYSVHPDPLHDKPDVLIDSFPALPEPVPVEHETITLIDKLSTLVKQVEHILYQQIVSPPQRTKPRRSIASKPVVAEEQDAALRAIFKDNVDLRRNVEQLSSAKTALKPTDKNQLARRDTSQRTINIPSQPAA